jgi:glucose/arabinose dehydrogenase
MLAFGPDGMLYVGMGDGGDGGDPHDHGENPATLLGSMLRLDVASAPYGIPADNPFVGHATYRPETWAFGLRNPWRFSFDRKNGRLYIGDVGQGRYEEVDTLAPSRLGGTPENFMWDVYEGRVRSGCSTGGLRGPGARIRPINVYSHSLGCSITGGHVYRGRNMFGIRGWYHFADFCSGRIWRLKYDNGKLVKGRRQVLNTQQRFTSFGEGVGGELYLSTQNGRVYQLMRSS